MTRPLSLDDRVRSMTTFLRISDADLEQIVGASTRAVEPWRVSEWYLGHESRQRLDDLEALIRRLEESFKTPDGARLWLTTESGYFSGRTPVEALLTGRFDDVDAALEALDSGVFV